MSKFDSLEHFIRRSANRAGIDVSRYRPERSPPVNLARMLDHHQVSAVLDVGANTGQFAQALRAAGYRGKIVSFEPLSDAHANLLKVSARDPDWQIAARCAVGDRADESVEIHVAANSVSSSLLPMQQAHANAEPKSRYVRSEQIPMARLDQLAGQYCDRDSALFVKIDTQGFEEKVLNGATGILDKMRGLQLEMSFVTLYQEQALFETLLARVRDKGYSIWAIWPGFHDPASGRMLQVDVVLFRD